MLTNSDIAELTDLRRSLHRRPELSGQETATAAGIAAILRDLGADQIITGIGGAGVVAMFRGPAPGPVTMFRAELDALPIPEAPGRDHRSIHEGVAHLCGHDGHMAGLIGLARLLARRRPARGAVMVLFQPAEETGAGAAAMISDAALPGFDYGFAIHNFPGLPLGRALLGAGVIACASVGMQLLLSGATSHASEPEKARTPAPAIAAITPALAALSRGAGAAGPGFRLATVTHLRMGVPAFGITPGEAEIRAVLRAHDDDGLAALRAQATGIARQAAQAHDLDITISWHEHFAASVNDPQATAILARAAAAAGISLSAEHLPMRASEDFGRFGAGGRTAMILMGAGADHPPLHAQDYDYPDALIAPSVGLLARVAGELNG
ncbi:MAG: amidohydrolase [Paracoccus sp. (in: a-proteobacteria)]|nr:amidohydrolase [Paracoccus sp. (in: a-proteobacteria)]